MKDIKYISIFSKSISLKIQNKLNTSSIKYSFSTLKSLLEYSSTLTSIGSFIYDDVHPFLICLYFLHKFRPPKEILVSFLGIKESQQDEEKKSMKSEDISNKDTTHDTTSITPINKYTLILLLFYIKLSNQPIQINIFLNDYRKITVITSTNKKVVKYLDEIVYELLTEDWVLDIPVKR